MYRVHTIYLKYVLCMYRVHTSTYWYRVHTSTYWSEMYVLKYILEDGRRGSNVYEVNPWLWQFGRGKPHIGGLTIEETEEMKDDARKS